MTIQHKDIPDAQLHEPKGIVAAPLNSAYFSDALGSGDWKKVGAEVLRGLTGDGGVSGMKVLTDGSNGFTLSRDKSYGVMAITNNTTALALTAAVDPTLVATSDYVLATGAGAPWSGESLFGVTFSTDRLTVTVSGVYDFRAWANISAFPTNATRVGFRFRVNGGSFSPRTTIVKANSAADYGNFSAFGLVSLNAGDYVQLYVASSHTGNLVVQNANCTAELLRAT